MKPIAILTADIHRQESPPVSRTDDFLFEQDRKLVWLKELQFTHQCPILDAGDLFSYWNPPLWLLYRTISLFPKSFYTIPGNHDLPGHNLKFLKRSGLALIEIAGALTILTEPREISVFKVFPFPYGTKPVLLREREERLSVAIVHDMVYQEPPWPGCEGVKSTRLLRKMKGYDLIISGHNHQSFTEEFQGRRLVNPGSLMRRNVAQEGFKPRVALWYPDNTIKWEYVPIASNVLSREHILQKEQKEQRMAAFVEQLKSSGFEISSSFERNVENLIKKNKVRQSVKEIIMESMEG